MTGDELIERLRRLPQEEPVPGVHLIMIRERPLIKTMAILTRTWTSLKGAVAMIKTISAGEDSSRCGTAILYDLNDDPGFSAWFLVDALAVEGELAYVVATAGISDPGSERLCRDFGLGLMAEFKAATKAMKDVRVISQEDL
jgi:hypothetical protein